jgi:hypothetical protein
MHTYLTVPSPCGVQTIWLSSGLLCRLRYEDPCDPNFCYPRLDDPFGEEEAQRKRECAPLTIE